MTATLAEPVQGRGAALWRLRIGFVLVPLVHSAGMNLITVFAFRFLTDSLAISAGAAGLIFALVKIYDGCLDPAVGAWSDRIKTPWGRRLPFLFAGALMMPAAIAMVFNTPDFGSVLAAQAFLFVALALHASAYTCLTIPGMAMLVESTDDYHERTVLMAYRTFGNSIGVIFGSSLPAWLLATWGATRSGHSAMAAVIAAIVLVAGVAAAWCLRDAPRTEPDPARQAERYNFIVQARLAWANLPFRLLAIAHIFVLFGTAVASAVTPYFSKYVLQFPDSMLGTYFLLATIGSVGSMPLWVAISKRAGKKQAYIIALALFGLIHLAWVTASLSEPAVLLALRSLTKGFASGGVILCSYSMLSDAVRYDYVTSGLRREGAFAGFTTLFDKLSAAAGVAAMGAILNAMGYIASKTGQVAQPPSALMAITLCLAGIPVVAMAAAILVIRGYRLDAKALAAA